MATIFAVLDRPLHPVLHLVNHTHTLPGGLVDEDNLADDFEVHARPVTRGTTFMRSPVDPARILDWPRLPEAPGAVCLANLADFATQHDLAVRYTRTMKQMDAWIEFSWRFTGEPEVRAAALDPRKWLGWLGYEEYETGFMEHSGPWRAYGSAPLEEFKRRVLERQAIDKQDRQAKREWLALLDDLQNLCAWAESRGAKHIAWRW